MWLWSIVSAVYKWNIHWLPVYFGLQNNINDRIWVGVIIVVCWWACSTLCLRFQWRLSYYPHSLPPSHPHTLTPPSPKSQTTANNGNTRAALLLGERGEGRRERERGREREERKSEWGGGEEEEEEQRRERGKEGREEERGELWFYHDLLLKCTWQFWGISVKA